jgi:N-acetylneuraminate synthase
MTEKRQPPTREIESLDALVRGVYAKRDLPVGHQLAEDDVFLAVPLLKGQLSCRELIAGEELIRDVSAKRPITIDALDNPYSRNSNLRDHILSRGLDPE